MAFNSIKAFYIFIAIFKLSIFATLTPFALLLDWIGEIVIGFGRRVVWFSRAVFKFMRKAG